MSESTSKQYLKVLSLVEDVLKRFDTDNRSLIFKMTCLREMLTNVEPLGEAYLVSTVYKRLSEVLGTNIFIVRGAFTKLRKAGLVKRQQIQVNVGNGLVIETEAFFVNADLLESWIKD